MSRYINFYTDFAFKKIFGTEANKDLLISFLNCLLDLQGDKEIEDLTYLNSEQLGEAASERRAIYDVYCRTAEGERFIVEMQKAEQDHFIDRSIYYSSFAIREQAQRGAVDKKPWDYSLSSVYVVGILNFEMDETKERSNKVITRVKLKDDENRDFSDKLNFIFLEMPKFRKKDSELKTLMDKWLYVIKNLYQLESEPSALTEGIFHQLFKIAEIAAFTKEERYDYEESLKNFRDLYNTLSTAERKGIAKGRKEGRKEGEAIGMQKGRAEGRKEGEAIGIAKGEREASLRNAKNLKTLGVDIETIVKATGLTKAEIEKL